jgi:hypothetical protein
MRINDLYPFYAAFSALDPRSIPKTAAQDHLNAREEDGTLKFRFGYRNLLAAQANFSAVFGLGYLQGFSGTTELEEYVTAETISGNTRFYSRPADDGDPATEIKNGVASVNVDASEWVFPTFDDDAFFINPSSASPVYRHLIGDATNLTAIAIPTAPSVAPSYIVSLGGGATPYTQISFDGINTGTEITYSGAAHSTDSSVASDGSLLIGHANSKVESSFEVDLNGATIGVVDHTYNDAYAFSLQSQNAAFEIGNIRFQWRNNDGTPKVLTPTETDIVVTSTPTGKRWALTPQFIDKLRADYDNLRYFKLLYTVVKASSTAANNILAVSKPFVGGIDMRAPVDRSPDPDGLEVGYTYYFSTPQFESGISPLLFIPNTVLAGYSPGSGFSPLGVHLEITMTVSGDSNVDNFRVYARSATTENDFHRVVTQVDSDATYDLRISYVEITRLTVYEPTPFVFANVTNMFQYKGHAVWLYKGGLSNVRYARNGDALRQASSEDASDDTAAGETFTLADNGADEPLGGIQAGDGVILFGKYGVHTQIGDRAVEMTPPRRISGSQGAAGKCAFTRYKDDNGITGGAYMTPSGQVLFSIPGAFNDKEVGGTVNLTELVRDGELSPKDFLLDEQASALSLTNFATCRLGYDDRQDALWVIMGRRAMVLRRASLLSGARYWEHYEYTTGSSTITIAYPSFSGKRGIRWIRSDGKFDEAEYNSTTGAFISGSNSDGGAAAPAGYWESKVFAGQIVQVSSVDVERDDYTDTPTVTIYSEDSPSGNAYTLASGNKTAKAWIRDSGSWYKVRVTLSETTDPIRRLIVYEIPKGRNIRG